MDFENFNEIYDYIDDMQIQCFSREKFLYTGDIVKIYCERDNKHFNLKRGLYVKFARV